MLFVILRLALVPLVCQICFAEDPATLSDTVSDLKKVGVLPCYIFFPFFPTEIRCNLSTSNDEALPFVLTLEPEV